jgi:hypothetical protein
MLVTGHGVKSTDSFVGTQYVGTMTVTFQRAAAKVDVKKSPKISVILLYDIFLCGLVQVDVQNIQITQIWKIEENPRLEFRKAVYLNISMKSIIKKNK